MEGSQVTHPRLVSIMRPWWRYGIIFGMVFMLAAAAQEWRQWVPAEFWFEVRSVHIHDTVAGVSPRMDLDRVIRRPFSARWIVTVMRERPEGGFFTHCSAAGVHDYRPENVLPPDLDLDWWTWPRVCELRPARYRVHAAWYLQIDGWPPKTVRTQSNVFEVRPRADAD